MIVWLLLSAFRADRCLPRVVDTVWQKPGLGVSATTMQREKRELRHYPLIKLELGFHACCWANVACRVVLPAVWKLSWINNQQPDVGSLEGKEGPFFGHCPVSQ